jgi:hypothetical protein
MISPMLFERVIGRRLTDVMGGKRGPSLDDDLSAHASKTGVEGPYELPIVEDVNVWL